jgi:hypothetical protein
MVNQKRLPGANSYNIASNSQGMQRTDLLQLQDRLSVQHSDTSVESQKLCALDFVASTNRQATYASMFLKSG